jgi:signal transduction histidine kinase
LLQGCFALSLQLHAAVDQLPADLVAKPRFVALAELMARVLEEGRFAVRGLRSPHEHLRSLGQAFAAVPTELGLDPAVGFRVTVDGRPNELRPVVRDEVYRIGREAIVNAYRHSRAKNIEMLIEFRPAQLRIAVRDDGCGIDSRQLKCGQSECWGLQGMRERAVRSAGKFAPSLGPSWEPRSKCVCMAGLLTSNLALSTANYRENKSCLKKNENGVNVRPTKEQRDVWRHKLGS